MGLREIAPIAVAVVAFASPLRAEVPEAEEAAAAALKRPSTNLQFHKDSGRARLIRFSQARVTDEMLAPLEHLAALEYVAIVSPKVTDAGIAHVAGLTNLKTLLLSGTKLTDAGLEAVEKLENLERLYLADTEITDAGLKSLAALTQLETLSLENTSVGDEGIRQLAALTDLETLFLGETRLGDAGLKTVSELPKLKVLFLNNCEFTAAGLAHLAKLEHLEHLSLNHCRLDEGAVDALAKLSGVKVLELYGTHLTPAQLDDLRSKLPKTAVYGEKPPRKNVATATNAETKTVSKRPVEKPIRQRLADDDVRPDFQKHVIPLLGRLGCNGRSCHGSFQGRGGFRLSMFGYDFDLDHENLSERIDLEKPGDSLILNKPTSDDEHGGGERFKIGSWQQLLLRRWIEAGAPNVQQHRPQFVRLDVEPAEVVFEEDGETVQLRTVALWSDGSREDVTELTRFETKDDGLAEVSPGGLVESRGRGDSHIIAYYDNGIVPVPVLRAVADGTGADYPDVPTPTKIDELVVAKLKTLGIVPSELTRDAEFLRRVSIDITGTLPTPAEIEAFVADETPDKRAKKIDELLERPAYVTWWTNRLCDLTSSNAGYLGNTQMAQPVAAQWRTWIERRVRDNVGWDEIVRGIVTARSRRSGQSYREFIAEQSAYTRRKEPDDFAAPGNPMPHFWFRSNISTPRDKALAFGYTFLGVRLDCAQCHKHPFDQWSQQDFQQFTAFFERIRSGVAPDAKVLFEATRERLAVPDILNTAATRRQSYMRIAAEGRPIPWREIYVEPPGGKPQPARLLGGAAVDLNDYEDPRELLMQWLLDDPNRYFARAFVNRIWANYFHRGIVEPPDDLNLANPPVNRALFDHLVEGFIESGYDMKWLHRTIAGSRTYQLSYRPNETNRTDERNFSHAIVRRMPAEVAIDAIGQATASDKKLASVKTNVANRKIGQHPRSFQARSIDYSLLIFGKPLRTTNCDCERQNEPTLIQSLYVRNDRDVYEALSRGDGWLAQLRKEKPGGGRTDGLIRQAYLRTLSRKPNQRELADARNYLGGSDELLEGLEDLMWALLNSQEFITNH